MKRVMGILSDIFFPRSCLHCGRSGSGLCVTCSTTIPTAETIRAENTFALYNYGNKIVAKAIRNLKYFRKSEAALALMKKGAPAISEWLSDFLQSEKVEHLLIVPIPQHQNKARLRGYNQTLLLARVLRQSLPNTKLAPLLLKNRLTLPQVQIKNRTERLSNLKNSMVSQKKLNPQSIYILVDDVTTTGATFSEATRALQNAGAQNILCVALAHGDSKTK